MATTGAATADEEQIRAVIADRAAAMHDRELSGSCPTTRRRSPSSTSRHRWRTRGRKPATPRRCGPGLAATLAGPSAPDTRSGAPNDHEEDKWLQPFSQ